MGKRIALGFGLAVIVGAVLLYVLWNGPGGDETAPKRPDRRNLTKLLEKSAAPPAGKEQEKVPPDLLDRATRAATRPAPAAATQPNYIKSSDVPEDNGMHWFLLAAELMPELNRELGEREDNMFEFGWQDDSRISDQIDRCRKAFDAVRKGLEVGNAMLPLEPEKSVPPFKWHELTQLMTLDAMRKAGSGDFDAALEIYDVLLDFSAESCRGGFFAYHLAAGGRQRIAAQQLCKTLQAPGVSAEQYRVTMERLAALDARAPTLADAMAVEAAASEEYWFNKETSPDRIRDGMRSAAKDWDEAGKQFVENASISDLVELYRQCVEVSKQVVPLFEAELYEFDYAAYQKLIDSNRLSKNMGGDAQRRFLSPSLSRAQRRGTMLVAAIEAYHRDKGTYPASLDAVATALAVDLPKDPFTGTPFGYVQQGAGYLLYSAGINMLDDGGKGKPWDPKQDDYVIVRRE